MKTITLILLSLILLAPVTGMPQGNNLDTGQTGYVPSGENLENREWFRNARFGMFIHWGISSVLGKEIGWALSGQDINQYRALISGFNPQKFDAAGIVGLAKAAGMKYITFTTRHHDSFSMFNTQYSDWNIMDTPYGKDVLKQLADECRKQGIRLYCYYSLTDFYRADYCQGNVKKATGIQGECDWEAYLQFMKNQLTEILTQYGPIYGIWFDGHWDQVEKLPGGRTGNQKRAWRYHEIYRLIHELQPGCMIVNNHHLAVFPGEDYQTFERDLPGENTGGGYSADAVIARDLPLESNDIIGKRWGYVDGDTINRSTRELIHLLIRSAGRDANFLLNIGPTPDGEVREAHRERLLAMGEWLNIYGETIYGTHGCKVNPGDWGVAVEKDNKVYLHIINPGALKDKTLTISEFQPRIRKAVRFETGEKINFSADRKNGNLRLMLPHLSEDAIDQVVVLYVR